MICAVSYTAVLKRLFIVSGGIMNDFKKLLKCFRRIQKMKKGFKSIRKNWKKILVSIDAIKKAVLNK